MSSLITYDEMKAALGRAVAERGEGFVYPEEWKRTRDEDPAFWDGNCMYRLEDGTPGCIVGLAVSYVRPDVILSEFDCASNVLAGIAEPEAAALAGAAQERQDAGHRWGEALEWAFQHKEDYL